MDSRRDEKLRGLLNREYVLSLNYIHLKLHSRMNLVLRTLHVAWRDSEFNCTEQYMTCISSFKRSKLYSSFSNKLLLLIKKKEDRSNLFSASSSWWKQQGLTNLHLEACISRGKLTCPRGTVSFKRETLKGKYSLRLHLTAREFFDPISRGREVTLMNVIKNFVLNSDYRRI
jgi:hypothetical protein